MLINKRYFLATSLLIIVHIATATFKDAKLFIKNAFKNPNIVGAVLPSSAGVGKELMSYVVRYQKNNPNVALNLLEVGAGTGSMTEVIVASLRDIDHLDLIEISPEFCQILHDKFDKYPNVRFGYMDHNHHQSSGLH